MIHIHLADRAATDWSCRVVAAHHYLRKAPDRRSRPLCYVVRAAQELVGCLFFGRPESTRCFAGGLTYGSIADVAAGRAAFDRWEILNLSRVWLSPDVQPGGRPRPRGGRRPGFARNASVGTPRAAAMRTTCGHDGSCSPRSRRASVLAYTPDFSESWAWVMAACSRRRRRLMPNEVFSFLGAMSQV